MEDQNTEHATTDADLDEALARAVRKLIAEAVASQEATTAA